MPAFAFGASLFRRSARFRFGNALGAVFGREEQVGGLPDDFRFASPEQIFRPGIPDQNAPLPIYHKDGVVAGVLKQHLQGFGRHVHGNNSTLLNEFQFPDDGNGFILDGARQAQRVRRQQ